MAGYSERLAKIQQPLVNDQCITPIHFSLQSVPVGQCFVH